jgi:hypothetical protein
MVDPTEWLPPIKINRILEFQSRGSLLLKPCNELRLTCQAPLMYYAIPIQLLDWLIFGHYIAAEEPGRGWVDSPRGAGAFCDENNWPEKKGPSGFPIGQTLVTKLLGVETLVSYPNRVFGFSSTILLLSVHYMHPRVLANTLVGYKKSVIWMPNLIPLL